MIKQYILFALIMALSSSVGIRAMEASGKLTEQKSPYTFTLVTAALALHTFNTYREQEITRKNLLQLTPKLDQEGLNIITEWLYDHKHVIAALTNFPIHGTPEERIKRAGSSIPTLLQGAELKNLSNYNYVFVIENKDRKYVIKIAGPANRRENYNALLKKDHGTPLMLQDYQWLEDTHQLTCFQALSRAAHSLRIKEWVGRHPCANVDTPNSYIVHIPGQPDEFTDSNYVIVEDYVENIGTPDDKPQIFLASSADVAEAIAYAGLWNIGSRQFLIDKRNKVIVVDLEQPNNTDPKDFFHRNREKCIGNTHVGLAELSAMCQALNSPKSIKESDPKKIENEEEEFVFMESNR